MLRRNIFNIEAQVNCGDREIPDNIAFSRKYRDRDKFRERKGKSEYRVIKTKPSKGYAHDIWNWRRIDVDCHQERPPEPFLLHCNYSVIIYRMPVNLFPSFNTLVIGSALRCPGTARALKKKDAIGPRSQRLRSLKSVDPIYSQRVTGHGIHFFLWSGLWLNFCGRGSLCFPSLGSSDLTV